MNISFDRYHKYGEIRSFLQECVRDYPDLTRIECIGESYQGREILMLEVTNRKTGPGEDKPAVYADGNTHAGEVTGCEVVLYTIKTLLEGYGKYPRITDLLDTRVFYFVPRITVDGSEHYLTTPYMLRSSLHPWPFEGGDAAAGGAIDEKPGLYADDVDGDGLILQMRVKDPGGAWKVSGKDPRLMVRRRADDMGAPGETYYDLYQEGFIKGYDPDVPVKAAPGRFQLDFNRQYPANWQLPSRQRGSGEYPLAEPETKAVADFLLAHPNIVTSMSYHTSGGILLRPFANKSDREFEHRDLALYQALGEIGQEQTGYPLKSIFESFTFDPSRPEVGSGVEWAYESLGILAFETELWDMQARAGIPRRTPQQIMSLSEKDREEDGLRLLKWQDEKMGGKLFHDWRPLVHPQLGDVEIGGWEPKMGRQNPPVFLLEEECRKNAEFNLSRAAVTPRLVVERVTAAALALVTPAKGSANGDEGSANGAALAGGVYKIEAVVANDGYLATNVTAQAIKMRQAKPVRVKIQGSGAGSLIIISGEAEQEIGHLGGRSGGGDSKVKMTWVVRGPKGAKVVITAWTSRAGKAKAEVVLE